MVRWFVQSVVVAIGAIVAFLLLGIPGVLGWISGALSFICMRESDATEFAEADVR